MALKGWYVNKVSRKEITEFIETWHYSGSINGCIADYCYALFSPDNQMKGAMFFGRLAMANQWKPYVDNPSDIIELRRLACVDETPKNSESFFIGKSLKLLKKEWNGKIVISYADKEYGHSGVIYKATNFELIKEIPGARIIIYKDKRYHDKVIRTKYKGELKPFAKRIREALETKEAYYKTTLGKYVYVYRFN